MERLCSSLRSRGFDVLQPFSTVWYNQHAKPIPTLIDLPVKSDGSGLPALLVGNSKSLWPFFMEDIRAKEDISSDPLDRFVQAKVNEALEEVCVTRSEVEVFYSFETAPDRLIAFQRLADVCGVAYLEESIHLCLHPTFGPWFALRAIIVFKSASDASMDVPLQMPARVQIAVDPDERQRGEMLLSKAIEAKQKKEPDAWRIWVNMRDAFSNGKEHRYSDHQLQYHYTKNKDLLATAV